MGLPNKKKNWRKKARKIERKRSEEEVKEMKEFLI